MFPEYVNQLSTMLMTGEEEMPELKEEEDEYTGDED